LVQVAPNLENQRYIYSLAIFNDKLYGGTGVDYGESGGKLFEWNGTDAWVKKANQSVDERDIYSLAIFEGNGNGNGVTKTSIISEMWNW